MCGIAGYVDLRNGAEVGILASMADALAHRGPDAHGTQVAGAGGLAHARLSIIDLATSTQPMQGARGWIVFNGEIYNYQALRPRLEAEGVRFRTRGDTEVLLRGVETKGLEFLPTIAGMFAFAHWDPQAGRLLLARDRFGEKPLFFARPRPDLIVFASEPKAVLRHPEVGGELDLAGLTSMLRHRAIYGTGSLVRGVEQLPPGCALTWSASGSSLTRWFDLVEAVAGSRGIDHGPEALRRAVLDSVALRTSAADVPVGAFLSGGIDSSIVVASMRRAEPSGQIHTFSVSFEGDPDDEHRFASSVAERFATTHHRRVVTQEDFIAALPRYSVLRDAPMNEPADVAVGLMSRLAKEHVKVVLSGEGADEFFAGYPKFGLAGVPTWTAPLFRALPPATVERLARRLRLPAQRIRVALDALRLDDELARAAQWFAAGSGDEMRAVFPAIFQGEDRTINPEQRRVYEAVAARLDGPMLRMQVLDILTWLPGNLLERGDRMTMSEGLEARMPFLDLDVALIGLAGAGPTNASPRRTKRPLRTLAAELVGEDIANRRKWGFKVPLQAWFQGRLGEVLRELLEAEGALVQTYGDRARALALLAEHRRGERDHQKPLWSILTAESWNRHARLAWRR